MCGIVSTFGHDCEHRAWQQYRNQEHRGSEGYGFLALKDSKIVAFKRTTTEDAISRELKAVKALAPDTILFHHRYPTSTLNTVNSAHPLPIEHKDFKHRYYMLHNGVVHKAGAELEISDKGYTFMSEVAEVKFYRAGGELFEVKEDSTINDSEILGFYVAEYLEGRRKDIPMTGAIACIVVQEDIKTGHCEIFFMRNTSNPLKVYRDKNKKKKRVTLMIASEGKGVALDAGKVWKLNPRDLTLIDVCKVDVGEAYTVTYGKPYSSAEDYYGIGFNSKPDDVPTRALPFPKDNGVIIDREAQRLRDEADKAWAEVEEAKQMLQGDDSVDGKMFVRELQEKAEDIEQELAILKE